MRIRKHANLANQLYATSSLINPNTILQPHVCHLNQSPWDVIGNFSPPSSPPPPPPSPPPQVYQIVPFAGNESSMHCVSVFDREINQWVYSGEYLAVEDPEPAKDEEMEDPDPEEEEPVKDDPIIFCSKTDGKSWQCRREAAKGNSMCEHHLNLIKSYGNYNSAQSTTKKTEKTVAAEVRARRARPKRVPVSSSTNNPYEFYYYSGFGPRWGRKRGESCTSTDNNGPNVGEHDEMEGAMVVYEVGDDEFDYVDEDEDEDEEYRANAMKRARKPIKERSLKSLM